MEENVSVRSISGKIRFSEPKENGYKLIRRIFKGKAFFTGPQQLHDARLNSPIYSIISQIFKSLILRNHKKLLIIGFNLHPRYYIHIKNCKIYPSKITFKSDIQVHMILATFLKSLHICSPATKLQSYLLSLMRLDLLNPIKYYIKHNFNLKTNWDVDVDLIPNEMPKMIMFQRVKCIQGQDSYFRSVPAFLNRISLNAIVQEYHIYVIRTAPISMIIRRTSICRFFKKNIPIIIMIRMVMASIPTLYKQYKQLCEMNCRKAKIITMRLFKVSIPTISKQLCELNCRQLLRYLSLNKCSILTLKCSKVSVLHTFKHEHEILINLYLFLLFHILVHTASEPQCDCSGSEVEHTPGWGWHLDFSHIWVRFCDISQNNAVVGKQLGRQRKPGWKGKKKKIFQIKRTLKITKEDIDFIFYIFKIVLTNSFIIVLNSNHFNLWLFTLYHLILIIQFYFLYSTLYTVKYFILRARNVRKLCQNLKMLNNIFIPNNISRLSLVLGNGSWIQTPKVDTNHNASLCLPCGPSCCIYYSTKTEYKSRKEKNSKFSFFIYPTCIINLGADTKYLRHLRCIIILRLCHDIEPHPGPTGSPTNETLTLVTLNCRGLNNIDKFRLLLNKAYKLLANNPNTVIMLQETMIIDCKYLDMSWRGSFALTPGTGNSQGCLTLLGADKTIVNQNNIGNRAHVLEVDGISDSRCIIANIYAPTGYRQEKRAFFRQITDILENYTTENLIFGGDFNLTFHESDRLNRQTSVGEKNIADELISDLKDLNLNDCWEGFDGLTWRRGNSMSRLDRIYFRNPELINFKTVTDWTICDTDHAAVVASFKNKLPCRARSRICRLNSKILFDEDMLSELRTYLQSQLNSLSVTADPHIRLEFAKMTVRTKALEIGKRMKARETEELKIINEDITEHIKLLERTTDPIAQEEIIEHIETKTNEKKASLDRQGKFLAWRAKTKWYNEGEKSNKYFLNMLKRNGHKSELAKLDVNGTIINDPEQITRAVVSYYDNLYNNTKVEPVDNQFLSEMFEVEPHEAASLDSPITLEELKEMLRPLKETAPGPDGISNLFIKKLWDILGPLIVDAWNYSLRENKLTQSHQTSYLRLIPKTGKNTLLLKNWRPITLSNCDHKLITRVYNKRLLKVLERNISITQTAYIKQRNISDNIRMIKNAIQLSNFEMHIDGSVVALDAQKAFDTVSHQYLFTLLEKIGIANFCPILKLLYKNLKNDVIIDGEVRGRHTVTNGVKQGDALSCTLFILAMEPLIRNVQKNQLILPIESRILQYEWPKIYGYADDITCVIKNLPICKQEIFSEYERFTRFSGLRLNADKTEIYDFNGDNDRNNSITQIIYNNEHYNLLPKEVIRINGLDLCKNLHQLRTVNTYRLLEKMDNHFKQWSKRNLSLLGKIQIYKTFGLSQFLYHLSVFEPEARTWKEIKSKINKFLWNKNYVGNQALQRIKTEVFTNDISKGGFGMIDIQTVVGALRLRRHLILMSQNIHPLHTLLKKLSNENSYFRDKSVLRIDDVTELNLAGLSRKRIEDYNVPNWLIESDTLLHNYLLYAELSTIIRPRKRGGREERQLLNAGIFNLKEAVSSLRTQTQKIAKIAHVKLTRAIMIIDHIYRVTVPPDKLVSFKIREGARWVDCNSLTSKQLRQLTAPSKSLASLKLLDLEEGIKAPYFQRLAKLTNVPNKTKMLRLLQKDVYCGERLVRFGMTNIDSCRRCFEVETIRHLLLECPYSREVWRLLGVNINLIEILGVFLTRSELEIRSDILSYLVFRQRILPPDVLVRTTLRKYADGIIANDKIKKTAGYLLRTYIG